MKNEPLISVVIPIYKVEKYLNKCIDSVMNQTYDNLEIILVDDGSPDNCGKMCDDYAEQDSRIKVVHKENGGLPSARNAGIDVATGEYITFVDSDDFIHEKMVETLYNNLVSTDSDISVCGFLIINEEEPVCDSIDIKSEVITLTKYDIASFSSLSPYIRSACGKLYKAELFEKVRFNNDIVKLEDNNFSYKIFTAINRICFDTTPMYYYLKRQGSIMNDTEYPVDYIAKTWDDVLSYYDTIDLDDEFKQTLIRYINCVKTNDILYAYYTVASGKGCKATKRKIIQLFNEQKKCLNEYKLWSLKMRIFDFDKRLFIIAVNIYNKLHNVD